MEGNAIVLNTVLTNIKDAAASVLREATGERLTSFQVEDMPIHQVASKLNAVRHLAEAICVYVSRIDGGTVPKNVAEMVDRLDEITNYLIMVSNKINDRTGHVGRLTLSQMPSAIDSTNRPVSRSNRVEFAGGCRIYVNQDVDAIGASKFEGCASIASANLPCIAEIGSCAFKDCESMVSLNAPNATSIGDGAFSGSGLRSIDISSISRDAVESSSESWGVPRGCSITCSDGVYIKQ